MELPPLPPPLPAATRPEARGPDALRETAEAFEAVFLTEMLKHTGVNALPGGFGGGAGEEAFGSFLTQEYARLLAARGGIGLAEQIYQSLIRRETQP